MSKEYSSTLEVDSCSDCPSLFDHTWQCFRMDDKRKAPVTGIPDWCPLPDEGKCQKCDIEEKDDLAQLRQQRDDLLSKLDVTLQMFNVIKDAYSDAMVTATSRRPDIGNVNEWIVSAYILIGEIRAAKEPE